MDDNIFERWKQFLTERPDDMPVDEDDGDIYDLLNWFKTEANTLYDQLEHTKADVLLKELSIAKVKFLSKIKKYN